jgi:hypothetical protein
MKMKSGDKRWAALGGSVFFLVILAVFIIPIFLKWDTNGLIQIFTFVTSAVVTVILGRISTGKLAFLKSFILAISLILAMVLSLLWNAILA